jgi:hypothetical protein
VSLLEHRETPNWCCYIRIQEKTTQGKPTAWAESKLVPLWFNMEKKMHRKNQTHSCCSDLTNTYCSRETQTIAFAMTQFKNITGKNTKLYSHVVRIQGKQLLLKQIFLHNTQ